MSTSLRRIRHVVALILATLLCLTTCFACAPELKKKITVEDAYGPDAKFGKPTPYGVMWLPDGDSFLYFFSEGEVTGLWRCGVESGEKEMIADWGAITQALRERRPHWQAPEMSDVNTTGRRDRPSTSISPDGGRLLGLLSGDLFIYEPATEQAEFITNNPAIELTASFSPDGEKVAYVREGDLYSLDLATGVENRLTERDNEEILNGVADWVYEEELSVTRSFWWSPDSSKIAFVQYDTSPIQDYPIVDHVPIQPGLELQKYPLAGTPNSTVRLGEITLEGGDTIWIDTGERSDFYITSAEWLPSGEQLSFMVMNRDQTRLELLFADPSNGESEVILVEEDPYWINLIGGVLVFVDDDRFVWASERDGWRHLYLYSADGALINRITKGEWEVGALYGINAEDSFVLFQATEKSPLERHVYKAALDGSGLTRLTEEEGFHGANAAPDCRYFIDGYSTSSVPVMMNLANCETGKLSAFFDGTIEALSEYEFCDPEFVTIEAEDGTTLYARITKPVGFDPDMRFPVVVYLYGGPTAQIAAKNWGWFHLFDQVLANHGFIVFTIDNRGSTGRGKTWQAPILRRLGEVELKDQLEGIRYLKSLSYVDSERIGIWGGSYGGFMSLTCLLKAPDVFKAGVAMVPVTDWRLYDTIYTERYIRTPQANPEGYEESSLLDKAANLRAKLLLIDGAMDNNVHMQNTIKMVDELVKADKDFQLMLYPQERHAFVRPHTNAHCFRLILDFFLEHLGGADPDW